MYLDNEFVDDAGLMSYSADVLELSLQEATFVHKILQGAQPGRNTGAATHLLRIDGQRESGEGFGHWLAADNPATGHEGHPVGRGSV